MSRRDAVIYIFLVMTLLAAQMAFVSEMARADSDDVTGSAFVEVTSSSSIENNFVSNVQEVWVDATGGTFTLEFEGESTGGLDHNALDSQIATALEGLSTITDVEVTGSGTELAPWVVTFNDPADPRVSLIANYSLLTGNTATATVDATGGVLSVPQVPIDPAGIVLRGNDLLIADHRIAGESVYDGVNLWEMSTDATTVAATGTTAGYSLAPNGLAYNGNLFMSDPEAGKIFEISAGPDTDFGTGDDDGLWELDTSGFGVTPVDVAWDAAGSQLLVAGSDETVTPVSLGADGRLGGGDDVVGTAVDFSGIVGQLIGLAYRADTDTLLLTDDVNPEEIFEVTKDGRLIRTIEIAFLPKPHDLVIAPATGGGGGNSIYVVDPFNDPDDQGPDETPEQDGRLWEIPSPLTNLRPFVDAGSDASINLGDPLTLTGDSYDDDQTSTPTLTWTKASGPGTVTFGSQSSLSTSVTFSAGGDYVLQLESTDGDGLSNTDTVSVQVTDPNADEGPTDTFIDDDDSIFEADIEWMAAEGITRGCNPPENDRFCPDDFVTRGQMAAFLVRALEYTDGAGDDLFLDDDGSTFENDIDKLGTAGVTRGCNPPDNNLYCPTDFVTRGQMAAFLHRALG